MEEIVLEEEDIMSNTKKFLAFSCPHCPLEDQDAVEWLLEKIESLQPNYIIHLGDGHEADSASRWLSEYTWTLVDEFRAHNKFLESIRLVSPGSKKIFVEGNHDANITALGRINPKIRELCDYLNPVHQPELMTYWDTNTKYIFNKRTGAYRLGNVTFSHGFKTGVGSDEAQSLLLGRPYGLFVSGHTHRPVDITQATKGNIKLPYWYCNAGTIRDMENVPYMLRKDRSNWGQAIIVGETTITKSPRMSKTWEAELIIHKMY